MTAKKGLPFRLGCTSYVYPDDILPNVRRMAPLVDDIEIILFESEELSSFPDEDTIIELAELSNEYDITYTIHFPTDLKAGSENVEERDTFIHQVKRVIELTRPLDPFGFILHLEGIEPDASEQKREKWYKSCNEVCRNIAGISQLDCKKICVENLNYPVQWHIDLVEKYGFSLCWDIGHLWLYNVADWTELLRKYLSKTRIIHLHGVSYERDHISLKKNRLSDVQKLLDLIIECDYKNIISIEVFNEKDTFESLEIVREVCRK